MRATLLTSAIVMGSVSVSMALPVAPQGASPAVIRIHGCHHTYGQDVTGWHRHDRACQTLRGLAGRKNRPMANTKT